MAPRSNWKGFLKLSLVSCSIALYPASSSSSRVRFNTLNRHTGNRLKRQFIDAGTGEVVETEDQIKGFQVDRDNYLAIEESDLDEIRIESTHTLEIEKFVPRAEIDPRYMDVPYYVAPTEKVGEEAFAVIRDSMREEGVVGLGRVVMSRRERIIMLEPWEKGLLGTMLRYGYEVRGEEPYFEDVPELKLDKDLKEMAKLIIKRKFGHFDSSEFNDRYEDAVVEMVRDKQAGAKPRPAKSAPASGNVINLMDALKRSLSGGERTPPEQVAAVPKKRASAKASQRDQPQFKLPIAGGKSKAAAAPKEAAAKPSRRKAS
jgi:DNA end-binding protein Ku